MEFFEDEKTFGLIMGAALIILGIAAILFFRKGEEQELPHYHRKPKSKLNTYVKLGIVSLIFGLLLFILSLFK